MRGTPYEATEAERQTFVKTLPSMQHGFAGTLDQLTEHLARTSKPELKISRVFDAPKRLVFEAWSTAEHVWRWFTPAPLTTSRCEVDLRPGGVFRVVMRMPDGTEHPMDARFTEVVPDERIVFEATIDGDLRIHTTVTFAESGGKTTLAVHQVYSRESPSTRGAHAGWTQTLDQLVAHVANCR
jgi:uncharacterized protein YndB with AHSA1/START domain